MRNHLWLIAAWLAVTLCLLAALLSAVLLLTLVFAVDALAHFKPGTHNAVHAIQASWCGKANRECWQGHEAIKVAKCESAWYWSSGVPTQARNGQYRGMFQMGSSERGKYGHGPDPWTQARAAHYYWVLSGKDWSPWGCKP